MTFFRLIGADVADAGPCAAGSKRRPPAIAATAAMDALITNLLVHGTEGRRIIRRHIAARMTNAPAQRWFRIGATHENVSGSSDFATQPGILGLERGNTLLESLDRCCDIFAE